LVEKQYLKKEVHFMSLDIQQKGSTTWILIVLLVIAIVLAICFYTQKRIIEKDRDNLAVELQSTKDMTSSVQSTSIELDALKKQNQDLSQRLTLASDSIKQLQKELTDAKSKSSSTPKKATTTTKKPSSKTTTKSTAKKTRK
jgi:uncharacterized membrane protein